MKKDKIIYWIATGLLSAGMLFSAYSYFTNPEVAAGFKMMGFPIFFMYILGVAKLLGAVALLAPVGNTLKEWAYAGFIFTFIGATWTHIATSTPFVLPLIFLAVLAVSYVFWIRSREAVAETPVGKTLESSYR